MSIWGKIIGGTAGFAIGGPLGAILGVMAGNVFDKSKKNKQFTGIFSLTEEHLQNYRHAFVLLQYGKLPFLYLLLLLLDYLLDL